MQKGFVKYCLPLLVLLLCGYGYLSATSMHIATAQDVTLLTHHTDFAIKSPLSNTEHTIDIVEKEIEEDESDLPVRLLASFNYAPDFNSESVGCFASANKDIPFYLIFCTIRV